MKQPQVKCAECGTRTKGYSCTHTQGFTLCICCSNRAHRDYFAKIELNKTGPPKEARKD